LKVFGGLPNKNLKYRILKRFILVFSKSDVIGNFRKISKKLSALLPKFGNFAENEKIMGKNTSISLGNHFESFIESTVSKGRFSNASEVVRAGLRLLEEEENRIIVLRNAIREGIESGRAVDFDPKKHLETLKSRKSNG
jgi:antitoxin ParD1/3/4